MPTLGLCDTREIPSPLFQEAEHLFRFDQNEGGSNQYANGSDQNVSSKDYFSEKQYEVFDPHAQLCGTILRAIGLEKPATYHVKVSFVEPGPQRSVMFRSKQVIHATPKCGNNTIPQWNSSFQYEIFLPESMDVDKLEGDILFTLYEITENQVNVFIGQVLVSLKYLLEQSTCGAFHGNLSLEDRTGAQLGGALELNLSLSLPPNVKAAARELLSVSKSHSENCLESKNSMVDTKRKTRALQRNKDMQTLARERKLREREYKQKSIEKENQALRKRLIDARKRKLVQTKPNYVPQSQYSSDQAGSSPNLISSKTEFGKVSAQCKEMEQHIANLEQEISSLKAAMNKDDIILKQFSAVQSRINEGRTVTTTKPKGKRRPKEIQSSGPSAAKLNRLKQKAVQALAEHDIVSAQVKNLLERKSEAENLKNTACETQLRCEEELQTIQSRLDNRVQLHIGGELTQANCSDGFLKIQRCQQDVRISIAVEKQRLEKLKVEHQFEISALEQKFGELEQRFSAKSNKLENENEKQATLTKEHEDLRASWKVERRENQSTFSRVEECLTKIQAENRKTKLK